MYRTIDSTPLGDVRWQCFTMQYPAANIPEPRSGAPSWMTDSHEVWYRDVRSIVRQMLDNPDFKGRIDYAPVREFGLDGSRRLENFMSGDWAWKQAVSANSSTHNHALNLTHDSTDALSAHPENEGACFVPIILGSDKTTVSVATGQNEYYPLYVSIGNVHNSLRRAHRNAVVLAAFLAIPKSKRKYKDDVHFRKFRRQLFHSSISRILRSLRDYMERPELLRCADGKYRKVVYGIGPYIADYPEQALLACIVQGWCPTCRADSKNLDAHGAGRRSRDHTDALIDALDLGILWDDHGIVGDVVPFTNDFPRADIHELIAPDILHQLIKGSFKDHLVAWVELYIYEKHGKSRGNKILSDIDRRLAVVPPFSKLRRFREGRGFKQWTGDDSKALMKVYLPAIHGYLPRDMVRAIRAFLEFCYTVRRNVHTPETMGHLKDALARFHQYREAFRVPGVREEGFSLPRQHSMVHYEKRIWEFAAPNGLCSSITESKHIKAVKEPWRRSNRFEALGQMLLTNQRMDKLAMSRVSYEDRGMLKETLLREAQLAIGKHLLLSSLAEELQVPDLAELFRTFLHQQLYPDASGFTLPFQHFPSFSQDVDVHNSAEAVFHAPSDPSGVAGMRREFIRAMPSWRRGHPRYDCVFINRDPALPALLGMDVARVRRFFSFKYHGVRYPCALVHWFRRIGRRPDEDTGMWIVQPRFRNGSSPLLSIIHLDTIYRAAHLIGVSKGSDVDLEELQYHESLDVFERFYVNKYIDHHAFEMLHM
ncbi:hypothetical protein OH77DRAFT_1408881 [Trametes cingulata]|nr:hypothetical protein OH77DRAFT_1408881 [Trametes cingulata]